MSSKFLLLLSKAKPIWETLSNLYIDFINEVYSVEGTPATFDSYVTHSRSGNATMTDSDGLIKWAPHNLVKYSEQFDNAAWVNGTATANTDIAPDGTLTADTLSLASGVGRVQDGALSISAGNKVTFGVWIKAGTATTCRIGIARSGAGTYEQAYSSTISLTSEWAYHSITHTYTYAQTGFRAIIQQDTGTTATLKCWGAHLYRSDLGGMVDNPDRGDSYVPTTSSAVYLPRRGHHVYNGSTWVNEGLFVESESRQNLLPYSIPDSTNWLESESTITENSIVAPDGETTASLITTTGTGPFVANNTLVLSNSLSYVFSAYLKAGTAPYVRLGHQSSAENGAWFDLSNGTIATVNDANNRATIEDVGNGWYRCSLYIATGYGTAANTFIGLSDADNSTTATTGVTCYAWGAQIEQTSGQLSSYIPTAGSAITRAAETLTIPSANLPYPTPNVIGSELVTNGTFDTATDWTLDSGWSISGGKLVGGSGANTTKAYQAISTTAGKVYQISYDVDAVSGTFVLEARQDTSGGAVLAGVTVSSGSNQALFFVAATGTTVVDFNDYGTSITIDNVSVKEIDPLSVSIQMDGRMTYADEGIDGQITQLLWAATSSTRIRNAVSTNTGSGRQDFQQANAGVYDNVLADADYYSPGILVPYNIASRHGSTFVNGAVDGTALTEDTTPVALPDLSSTDLDLAYDYMGTIRTFRIWDADLTDEGIEFVST